MYFAEDSITIQENTIDFSSLGWKNDRVGWLPEKCPSPLPFSSSSHPRVANARRSVPGRQEPRWGMDFGNMARAMVTLFGVVSLDSWSDTVRKIATMTWTVGSSSMIVLMLFEAYIQKLAAKICRFSENCLNFSGNIEHSINFSNPQVSVNIIEKATTLSTKWFRMYFNLAKLMFFN